MIRGASLEDLRTALGELLGAERRLRGRDPVRKGDLSHAQVRALFALERDEEATAGSLAKRADLSPASMTAMLDHLEAAGFVQRVRGAKDRRQVIVTLTDAGHELLAAKRADHQARWEQDFGEFSDEELETAVRVMRALASLLDGLGRERP